MDVIRAHAEVRRLVRALSLSQRFHLYLVVCRGPRVARATALVVRESLAAARGTPVDLRWLPRDPDDPSPDERLTRESATETVLRPLAAPDEASAAHGVVHVVDATGAAADDAWTWCFQRLNERRNVIAQKILGEVVMFVTPEQETLLASIAPDLWSIRSGTFVVDVDAPHVAAATSWDGWKGDQLRDATEVEVERRRAEKAVADARDWAAADPGDDGRLESVAIWLERLGGLLKTQGRIDEAVSVLSEATSLIERVCAGSENRQHLRRYLLALRIMLVGLVKMQGKLNDAEQILVRDVLPAIDELKDERSRAVALGQMADILAERGHLDEALRLLQHESLPAFERLGDERSRAATMGRIADVLQSRGQLGEAQRIRQEIELPVYEALGEMLASAVTLNKIADVEFSQGRIENARDILERRALPTSERLRHSESIAFGSWKLGQILLRQNKPADALPLLERAFVLIQQIGRAQGIVAIGGDYADLLEQTGAADRAAAVRAEIEPIALRLRPS